MNERKICFIICSNNEQQLEECIMYLSLLDVPEGYEMDLLTVKEAKSMCAGYNEAMKASDAKYKVYIHQDTFIINKQFLYELLSIFQNNQRIGMFGIIGAEHLSKDGVMWHEKRCGNFYRLEPNNESIEQLRTEGRFVDVIDGFFMATQYDILWREDILDGWDFYDVSQCLEFKRAGYLIYVPAQPENWVIHDCGIPSFWNYEKYRRIVVKEYPEIGTAKKEYRILFIHSDHVSIITLASAMRDMGHLIHIYGEEVSLTKIVPEQKERLEETLEEGTYDLAVTFNFSPAVSEACERVGVRYFAYCFDCPLLELYRNEACNDKTFIGVFDKKQYEVLRTVNTVKNLQYVPLATNTELFRNIVIKNEDKMKYKADVSFVGKLYDNNSYDRYFVNDEQLFRNEADDLLKMYAGKWNGENTFYGKSTNDLIEYLYSKEECDWIKALPIEKRYYEETMTLAKHMNELDRKIVINSLADRFDVKLYSDRNNHEGLNPRIRYGDYVDYYLEMPKVFYLSKINLNITSRSIESGVPQRVWDIMAVSGFCLTNWQPEIEDFFVPGQELDVFRDIDELLDKVAYYLKHEDKRNKIRLNGYRKLEKYHTYQKRMQTVFDRIMD